MFQTQILGFLNSLSWFKKKKDVQKALIDILLY